MCAALWTQNLREGLPSGPAAERGAEGGVPAGWLDNEVADAGGTAPPFSACSLAYGTFNSRFGVVHLAASSSGIRGLSLYETGGSFRARLGPARWELAGADALLARTAAELAEYFAGQREYFDLPLDLRATTPFDRRVLDAIAAIPYGATRTYGELAQAVGSPGAARAVGRACRRNPVPLLIACHRVVRTGGTLGGFGAGGPEVKARLLALERATLSL